MPLVATTTSLCVVTREIEILATLIFRLFQRICALQSSTASSTRDLSLSRDLPHGPALRACRIGARDKPCVADGVHGSHGRLLEGGHPLLPAHRRAGLTGRSFAAGADRRNPPLRHRQFS